jgi:DNA-binding beta-propeller fold protein YncE
MKDGPRLSAKFFHPRDVAIDNAGNVYVSDVGNHRIRRIDPQGRVQTVAGDGTAGFQDGAGAQARFFGQEALDVTPDGKTIYVADGNGGQPAEPYHRIRRVTLP